VRPHDPRLTEALRWLGSIGIFYVLGPAWVVASARLYPRLLPVLPEVELPLPVRALGAALAAGGLGLAAASMATMVRVGVGHPFDLTGHERLSRPTQRLLDRGVYAWSRNPMGLGDLMLYAGLALAISSLPSLLVNVPAYAALVGWNHRFNERRGLLERFGADWLAYERRTPWLVPGPRTLLRRLRRR
jgi:protein-S-isoprenylcysteine O-methyltransferase Ste14